MTKIAYFDCSSGISGDMILSAMIDTGLSVKRLESKLKSGLKLTNWRLKTKQVERHGLPGTILQIQGEKHFSSVQEMFKIIDNSRFSREIKDKCNKILELLVKAEANVHHTKMSEVHFHELNSLDTMIDIVGTVVGLTELGIAEVYSSSLNIGTAAPATMKILREVPVYTEVVRDPKSSFELVTPTGAAIIKALAKSFGPMPMLKIEKSGFGAGTLELIGQANLLRLFVGRKLDGRREKGEGRILEFADIQYPVPSTVYHLPSYESDRVLLLETNIDDMDPRIYPYVIERILESGGLDVWLTQIIMKKGRPGIMLSCLISEDKDILTKVVDTIFRETTTIGIRVNIWDRYKLHRIIIMKRRGLKEKVSTAVDKDIKQTQIEYDSAVKIARSSKIPLKKLLKS